MKKHRKQDIVTILFALILVIITFSLIIISLSTFSNQKEIPNPSPSLAISKTPPQVIYNSAAGARLANKIIHRQTLSAQDTTVKQTTLNTILKGNNSGIVYRNADVSVEYVKSMDLFMADILTPDTNKAKIETVTWFKNQGFSQQAICNLPLMFYLESGVSSEIQQDIQFSPLANGC